jgi:hypothetical protein
VKAVVGEESAADEGDAEEIVLGAASITHKGSAEEAILEGGASVPVNMVVGENSSVTTSGAGAPTSNASSGRVTVKGEDAPATGGTRERQVVGQAGSFGRRLKEAFKCLWGGDVAI